MDLETSKEKTLRLTGTIRGQAVSQFEQRAESFNGSKDALVGTLIEAGLGRPPEPDLLARHRPFIDLVKLAAGNPAMTDRDAVYLGLDYLALRVAPKDLLAASSPDPIEILAQQLRAATAAHNEQFLKLQVGMRAFFRRIFAVAFVSLFVGGGFVVVTCIAQAMRSDENTTCPELNQLQSRVTTMSATAEEARTVAQSAAEHAAAANTRATEISAALQAAVRDAAENSSRSVLDHENRLHAQIGVPGYFVEVRQQPVRRASSSDQPFGVSP